MAASAVPFHGAYIYIIYPDWIPPNGRVSFHDMVEARGPIDARVTFGTETEHFSRFEEVDFLLPRYLEKFEPAGRPGRPAGRPGRPGPFFHTKSQFIYVLRVLGPKILRGPP